MEIRTLRNISAKLVRNEERSRMFGNLLSIGIGTKEIEDFAKHEEDKMRTNATIHKKNRAIVRQLLDTKLKDNLREGQKLRKSRNRLRNRIEEGLGRNSRKCRAIIKDIKLNGNKLREKLRSDCVPCHIALQGPQGLEHKYGGCTAHKACSRRPCGYESLSK